MRDFPNWLASSYKRKDHPNPTYQDVYLNLDTPHINTRKVNKISRIKLFEKQISLWENNPFNFILISYNHWLSSKDYRKNLTNILDIPFIEKQKIFKTSSFGEGSSFTGIENPNISSQDVFQRYKTFESDERFSSLLSNNLHLLELSKKHIENG